MLPKVSILIPTLNASSVLEECLISIQKQKYPKELLEIIVADGGSKDATLELAKKYNCVIVENKLRTGESGKMSALKSASGEFCALIDSDNVLPDENWLEKMLEPLMKHPKAVGSEPWEYTWVRNAGFIDRYCALTGANDPFVLFLGNYDRVNLLTGKWTEVAHDETDYENYVLAIFDKRGVPTIGANGTIFRTGFLKQQVVGNYLFDIDILTEVIKKEGSVSFIKVKTGIIHNFCGSDISKFARKQKRRVNDFLFHKLIAKDRSFKWEQNNIDGDSTSPDSNALTLLKDALKANKGMLVFIVYCVTIIPLFIQTLIGYKNKKDLAWFFHPLACEITLFQYFFGFAKSFFIKSEQDRTNWKQ